MVFSVTPTCGEIENFGIRQTCVHILNPVLINSLTLDKLPMIYKVSQDLPGLKKKKVTLCSACELFQKADMH